MAQSGTVSFLFTDLVNSTRHLQAVGDEEGSRLFRAHHKLMTAAVTACGGQELQWLGDGLLAVFSSAADAVRCAISVQQTARRPVEGIRFEIRVGIHCGEALRHNGGYFGSSVVIARRVCDKASSGQILCTNVVAEVLSARHSFNFHPLGPYDLKGIAAPVPVSEILYEHSNPVALLNRTPFVGRQFQLQRLSVILEEMCNGHGSVVMLMGEPGIGKTRVIEEFADLAIQRNALVLRGACYDGEWQRPYGPFAEAINNYVERTDSGRLAGELGNRAAIIARVAPALRERMGQIEEPPALDKEEERFRLLDAVAQFFIATSRRAPIVLVLDDLHWADRGTVSMLAHLSHFVGASSILVLGAYRDAEVDPKHPLAAAIAQIRRSGRFESLSLKGLTNAELTEMFNIIGDHDAPLALVRAIESETGGNPFFVREVLLHLMEEGKLFQEGRWITDLKVEELAITEGVREVIERRLLRLSDTACNLLRIAATFNGAFDFGIAAAVAELDEETALSAIDEALSAQLLRPAGGSESFDFTHALIRNTLYSELSPPRRVRLHRNVAEAMEQRWGERAAEHAGEVAYHFSRAAALPGAERGVEYAIAAADNAETASAHDEVVGFLRMANDLMPRNDPRRARLLARLALVLPWTLNHGDGLEVAREAGDLIKATEGINATADFLEQAARAMHLAGRVRASWELARDGLRYAGDRRDLTWASLSELDLVREDAEDPENPGILTDSSRRSEVRAVLKTASREQLLARRIDPPFQSRQEILNDPEASAFAMVMMAGELRRGRELWQKEAAEAERRGQIAAAMTAWAGVAGCHISLGEFGLVQAAFDRAVALHARSTGRSFLAPSMFLNGVKYLMIVATDEGWEGLAKEAESKLLLNKPAPENNWSFALVRAVSAIVLAHLGRGETSMQRLATLPRALEVGAAAESRVGPMACDAAGALWLLNRTDNSAAVERALREKVIAPDFRFPMRDGRLSLARLCGLVGRYDEAAQWFDAARTILDEQGARPLRAITDFDQGLMYTRRGLAGDAELAHSFLDAADEQFQALRMTGWINRVAQTRALTVSN